MQIMRLTICTSAQVVGLLSFWISLNPQFDLANLINHSLREGWKSWQGLKTCIATSRISSLQRWRLGGIYSPFGKISRFIAIAILDTIPDTYGMTYTAPTVTKLLWQCEVSELPMNAGTPDPQHIWKPCNWVKVCEVLELLTHAETSDHRNSWLMSKLPTLMAFEN